MHSPLHPYLPSLSLIQPLFPPGYQLHQTLSLRPLLPVQPNLYFLFLLSQRPKCLLPFPRHPWYLRCQPPPLSDHFRFQMPPPTIQMSLPSPHSSSCGSVSASCRLTWLNSDSGFQAPVLSPPGRYFPVPEVYRVLPKFSGLPPSAGQYLSRSHPASAG